MGVNLCYSVMIVIQITIGSLVGYEDNLIGGNLCIVLSQNTWFGSS